MIKSPRTWRQIVMAAVVSLGLTASVGAAAPSASQAAASAAPLALGRSATASRCTSRSHVGRVVSSPFGQLRCTKVASRTYRWRPAPVVTPAPVADAPVAAAPVAAALPAAPLTASEIGQQALARLAGKLDPAKLGVEVVFTGTDPRYLGLFESAYRRVTVYVRPNMSLDAVTWVLAHELGHAVDVLTMGADQRVTWAQSRGYDVALWWPGQLATNDQSSGAGDFAESVAAWLVGTGLPFRSNLALWPSADQMTVLSTLTAGGR